jgi:transcriptional regulator GlxA family with amidase domain
MPGHSLRDRNLRNLDASGLPVIRPHFRGLRAARLQEILAEIRAGFADPALSPGRVALKLGVSARHVQNLLQQSGTSFTERVLELRLQKARTMLVDRSKQGLKVGDIARASGFNEVSHFNGCFRRRSGASPTSFRSAKEIWTDQIQTIVAAAMPPVRLSNRCRRHVDELVGA